MRLRIIYCCFLIHGTFVLEAQKNSEKGDKYFYQNQFSEAVNYYQLDVKSRSKKVAEHAMLRLADCYRISGEFELAEKAYQKLLKKFKKNPISYLNYGLALKSSAKYAEAKLQFEEYIRMNPSDLMGSVYLSSCDSAQKWLDETLGKEVKNIHQINTVESEFSPVLINDNIYFSSSREGSKSALISFDGGGNISRMDIYSIAIPILLQKEFSKKNITNTKNINTPAHEGSPSFSSDGNEMYFARTVKGKRDKRTNDILSTLQLFYSKKDSIGNWTSPISAFEFNSSQYSLAHPSLSKDGRTLYFMSDMPGGFGKTDIYYSVKDEQNKWTKPKNAGKNVNTFGHELFPYISSNNVLYFSSTAHPGMGQLDIFSCSYIDSIWQNVENLKPPFNSIGNDFGICFDESNARGLFSSDRFNGVGAEDIYSFANDTPLELSLSNDSIRIKNNFLFDDIKFKLSIDDTVVTEMPCQNTNIAFKLVNNKHYMLAVKKNGIPINKIEMVLLRDSVWGSFVFQIKTNTLPIRLKGQYAIEQTIGQLLNLSEDSKQLSETVPMDAYGKFILKEELSPELLYRLTHTINK